MRGIFVTATDTEVGKTVVAAAIAATLVQDGIPVRAFKPAVTGLAEPVAGVPADHELLAAVTGDVAEQVAPHRFGPAVSPHLATALAGTTIDPRSLAATARARAQAAGPSGALVVEGVGGLLVPITEDFSVRDLAVELALPVVIAARPGLGTINHTLLTLAEARRSGLDVRAVVLTPWPESPDVIASSNRATLERLAGVEVLTLPHVATMAAEPLASAGRALDPARWLDR